MMGTTLMSVLAAVYDGRREVLTASQFCLVFDRAFGESFCRHTHDGGRHVLVRHFGRRDHNGVVCVSNVPIR